MPDRVDPREPNQCPICRVVVPIPDGTMLIQGGSGTYTEHFHVACPCGWWDNFDSVKKASDASLAHATAHARA